MRLLGLLDILSYMPSSPSLRAPCIHARLRTLDTKSYETSGLKIAYFELTKSNVETANQRHWRTYFNTGEAAGDAPDYIKKASWVIEKPI